MQVDLYTKGVLTLIALALLGIFFQSLVGSSAAQSPGLTKVVICNQRGDDCVGTSHNVSGTNHWMLVGGSNPLN